MNISIPPLVFKTEDFLPILLMVPGFSSIVLMSWLIHRKGGFKGFVMSGLVGVLLSLTVVPGFAVGVAWLNGAEADVSAYGTPEYWFLGGMVCWSVPTVIFYKLTGLQAWIRKATPAEFEEQTLWEAGARDYPKTPLSLSEIARGRE